MAVAVMLARRCWKKTSTLPGSQRLGPGMIGAVLSVLQRMTSGSLAVSAEAHRSVVQKLAFSVRAWA